MKLGFRPRHSFIVILSICSPVEMPHPAPKGQEQAKDQVLGSQAGREHPQQRKSGSPTSMVGIQKCFTVAFHPSEGSVGGAWPSLDLVCICVVLYSPWYTRVGVREVSGLCLVCPVQSKPTLILPGIPEWELLRPSCPFWGLGISYHRRIPWSLSHPMKGQSHLPPGSRFHSERSAEHFTLFFLPFWGRHL